MNTHQLPVEVHIFDTDCYGVMWHGSYTKWLEMGRVNLCRALGIPLLDPAQLHAQTQASSNETKPEGFLFPVTEQNVRYRLPARLGDTLLLTTKATIEGYKLLFEQRFERDGQRVAEAVTTCVVVDRHWKPFRRIPAEIQEKI